MSNDIHAAMQADILAVRGVPAGAHTMSVGPGDVHIDAALSNLAVAFKPNKGTLIADLVMPVIPVAKRSDRYFVFAPSAHVDLARANIAGQMGMPAMSSWNLSDSSFAVSDYGFRDFVPADVESNADAPLRPLMDSTEILTDRLLLAREYRVATVVGTAANYGTNTLALAGGNQWDNPTSDPVMAIETAKSSPLVEPNVMVMGTQVWNALRRHPAIERYIMSRASTSLGATPLTVTPELFAAAFELDAVLIGKAKYNAGNPGAAVSMSYLWGKYAALIRIDPTPAMQRTSTFGYTFRYAPSGASPMETRTWYDMALGVRGGTWVKVTHSDAEKVVGGEHCGFLFTSAVS